MPRKIEYCYQLSDETLNICEGMVDKLVHEAVARRSNFIGTDRLNNNKRIRKFIRASRQLRAYVYGKIRRSVKASSRAGFRKFRRDQANARRRVNRQFKQAQSNLKSP